MRRTPRDAKKGASKRASERASAGNTFSFWIWRYCTSISSNSNPECHRERVLSCDNVAPTERDDEDVQEVTDAERSMFPLANNGLNNRICVVNYAGSTQVRQHNSNRRL